MWDSLYRGMKMMSVALMYICSYRKNKYTFVQQPSISCLGIGSPAVSGLGTVVEMALTYFYVVGGMCPATRF
jgi:hypothetical protein